MATRPERRPRDQVRRRRQEAALISLRNWYKCGKFDHCIRAFITIYLATPVSPFHAEPLHSYFGYLTNFWQQFHPR